MDIEQLEVGLFASNCYIVGNDASEALIIDPGDDAARILEVIRRNDLQVKAYLLTHGHVDHVSALAEVVSAFPAPVAIHPIDGRWAFEPVNQMPPYYDTPKAPPSIERHFDDGQEWTDAGFRYRVLFTPGHAPGHVSLYFEDEGVLFAGDVLFRGSVGRIDLPGGNIRDMEQSLRKLMTLPDDTVVYSGHGPKTTIGQERRTNPFLRPGALG